MLTGIKYNTLKRKITSDNKRLGLYIGWHNKITLNRVYYKHDKGHVPEEIRTLIIYEKKSQPYSFLPNFLKRSRF